MDMDEIINMQEKYKKMTIRGKTLEEVDRILRGIELEKQLQIEVTMKKIDEIIEKIMEKFYENLHSNIKIINEMPKGE